MNAEHEHMPQEEKNANGASAMNAEQLMPSIAPSIEGRVPTPWMINHMHEFSPAEFYNQSLTEADLRGMLVARKIAATDWTADAWFTKYHAQNLTQEFKEWWVDYYGSPSDYDSSCGEQDEYWKRCGFCLVGWCSAKTSNSEEPIE